MAKTKPKLFRVRLEDPEGSEFRVTTLAAADETDAQKMCERKELRIAAHEYPAAALAELERIEKDAVASDSRVPAQTRMMLATHRQQEPYKVVSVEAVN